MVKTPSQPDLLYQKGLVVEVDHGHAEILLPAGRREKVGFTDFVEFEKWKVGDSVTAVLRGNMITRERGVRENPIKEIISKEDESFKETEMKAFITTTSLSISAGEISHIPAIIAGARDKSIKQTFIRINEGATGEDVPKYKGYLLKHITFSNLHAEERVEFVFEKNGGKQMLRFDVSKLEQTLLQDEESFHNMEEFMHVLKKLNK